MRGAAIVCLALVAAGCAGYAINKDGNGSGYDVYTPEPYLLRKPIRNTNGELSGFEFDVVWLPNYSKRYRVHAWSGMGKGHFKFTFADGWKLTDVDADMDNTQVMSQLVDLAKHLIPAGSLMAAPGPGPERSLDLARSSAVPVLYKIEYSACGEPVGLKQVCEWPCDGEPEGRYLFPKKDEKPPTEPQLSPPPPPQPPAPR